MDAREALEKCDELRPPWQEMWPGFLAAAKDALIEKVAREEAEKPKRPSLESIECGLRGVDIYTPSSARVADMLAAADILKTLRERGGEIIQGWQTGNGRWKHAIQILLDLGVEPAK